MIDVPELEDRLRRTFDAVAATTRVDPAPRRRLRRRAAKSIVNVSALLAAVIIAALLLFFTGGRHSHTDVRTDTPATTSETTVTTIEMRSIPGMIMVGNENGVAVGYTRESYIHMSTEEYEATNARTMFPVTDADGKIVGYIARDVPFVPLAITEQPGFDIEKVRAARNGGCEDQIGDPNFKQEFPPCNGGRNGR